MEELEFRKQVYANPAEPGQEVLDAARENPSYQKILDQTRKLDDDTQDLVSRVVVPEGLREKLMEIPGEAVADNDPTQNPVETPAANSSFFHYYAMAASLILVIGVTYSLSFRAGPSAPELAMADEVMRHLYMELPEIALLMNASSSQPAMDWNEVDLTMAVAGVQLASSVNQQNAVFFANPCIILPQYTSAHLTMHGVRGAVNVFVIQSNPVSTEFRISEGRFNGVVVPMDQGNLILIGEQGENLEQFKSLLSDNMEWVI